MSPPGDDFVIQRHKMIRRIKKLWSKDINTSLFYTPGDAFKDENSIYMDEYAITHIVGYMTNILDKRYEKMLKEETISFEEVEPGRKSRAMRVKLQCSWSSVFGRSVTSPLKCARMDTWVASSMYLWDLTPIS